MDHRECSNKLRLKIIVAKHYNLILINITTFLKMYRALKNCMLWGLNC